MAVVENARPQHPHLLIQGGGVVTMDERLGELPVADVRVVDGRIAEVGPNLQVGDAHVIDARSHIVMPGFVEAHRHLWEGVIRNELPTEDLNGYFMRVNKGFAGVYTPEDAYLGSLVSALGALDSGITTVFDWAHIQTTPDHTRAAIEALTESGLRTVFGFGMPGAEDRGHQWPQDLFRLRKDSAFADGGLLTLALATLSPEHVPYDMAKAHFALAREAGVIVSVHSGLQGMGTPDQIERFGREGLLGPDVNLVHCNTLSKAEWQIIGETGTSVSITPSSEMQMGQGVPPIQQALDAGVVAGLGADVETSVPGDMWTQMRVLYALQRSNIFEARFAGQQDVPELMTPLQMLQCATLGGAACCGLLDRVGSLTPGKQADIVLLRTDMLNIMPVNDMTSAILLNADARNIDTVLVAGRIVKQHGRMLGVDMPQLVRRLHASRDQVFKAVNAPYDKLALAN
jgi:cytosine/adenosine deaminase-related metal-dependent hydrolase